MIFVQHGHFCRLMKEHVEPRTVSEANNKTLKAKKSLSFVNTLLD
jgi:hypothetical protein